MYIYKDNRLHCDQVALHEIIDQVGTPAYVYSARQMIENAHRIQKAFPAAQIHYSLKANANLSLIRRLHEIGLGMDAVSGGEIFRAIRAGVPPSQIVFVG